MLAEAVKTLLIPGSLTFLLIALVLGVIMLHAGSTGMRWGRRWLTTLTLSYLVLALPVVANVLIAGLEPEVRPIHSSADVEGARTLVVIGNGVVTYAVGERAIHQFARRTAFAVLEGARLYALFQPEWVIVSGGIPNPDSQQEPESVVIRNELVKIGVPRDRILLESDSRNTAGQLRNVARLVRERNIQEPLVVVTTPAHARRVMLMATEEGLDFVLATADALRYDAGEEAGWRNWVPSVSALRGSESALYEYLAVGYAWIGGR